ncbi:hypothetical protein FRC04_003707 [Tulasnella sp. 424]|nr:hypothetical protein FRC04_003707 [Tulasnella sp. 424]KAG8977037.1 hypothetical protein FRC05_002557 [Tulasnella sp. 425]
MNECTNEHCFYAFDTLYCHLNPKATPIPLDFPDTKYPLFVTWNIRSSSSSPRLRGCIGSFQPLDLKEGLQEYALISALNDTRFRPIQGHELRKLECGISLLTDFQDVPTYLDWEVGTHGIYISFPHPATLPTVASSSADTTPSSSSLTLSLPFTKRRSAASKYTKPLTATYLPDVAPAQGWTKLEAVDSAIRKAGYDGRITDDIRRSIKMRTYQAKKATVTWEEYWAWRTLKEAQAEESDEDEEEEQ